MPVLKGHRKSSSALRAALSCLAVLCIVGVGSGQSVSFTNESFFSHNGVIKGANSHLPIGSGFVIGQQKDVVTSWHVVEGARTLYHETNLQFVGGSEVLSLKPKSFLLDWDLAVFSASPKIKGAPFYAGDFDKVKVGDTILYVGYDVRQSSANRTVETTTAVAFATVAAKIPVTNNGVIVDALEFVGEAIPGYSGGAVYNTNMEIVAVMSGVGAGKVSVAHSIAPIVDLDRQILELRMQRVKTNGLPGDRK